MNPPADDSGQDHDAPRGALLRELKARAQRLEPVVRVGKAGVTPGFLAALDQALEIHELVKLKFDALKEQKKTLTPEIARQTGSHLIQRVGNVAVLYRRRSTETRLAVASD